MRAALRLLFLRMDHRRSIRCGFGSRLGCLEAVGLSFFASEISNGPEPQHQWTGDLSTLPASLELHDQFLNLIAVPLREDLVLLAQLLEGLA